MQPAQHAPSGLVQLRPSGQSVWAPHMTPEHERSTHCGQQCPSGITVCPEGQTGSSHSTFSQVHTGQHWPGGTSSRPSGHSSKAQSRPAQLGPVVLDAVVELTVVVPLVVPIVVGPVPPPPVSPVPPLPLVSPSPFSSVVPPQPTASAAMRFERKDDGVAFSFEHAHAAVVDACGDSRIWAGGAGRIAGGVQEALLGDGARV